MWISHIILFNIINCSTDKNKEIWFFINSVHSERCVWQINDFYLQLIKSLSTGYQALLLPSFITWVIFWMVTSSVGSIFRRSSIFWQECMTVV